MPVGTGTLYVLDRPPAEEEEANCCQPSTSKRARRSAGDEGAVGRRLRMERSGLNVTQRQESLVVQYLALGGHRHWQSPGDEDREPSLACSGVHAGPGQLSFGWNRRQRADLTLMFDKTDLQPALVFVHNYHEHGVHYRGHDQFGCPRYLEAEKAEETEENGRAGGRGRRFWRTLGVDRRDFYRARAAGIEGGLREGKVRYDAETSGADDFKRKLADAWSAVRPANVQFKYTTSNACDFFHGQHIYGARDCLLVDTDLQNLLTFEFEARADLSPDQLQANRCKFFARPPRHARAEKEGSNFLDPARLLRDIASGAETGFVTVVGGREDRPPDPADASPHFGFCVQSFACTSAADHISPHTVGQILAQNGWELPRDSELLDRYMAAQPARTLNSTTFHREETVSTSYLAWLMRERGFVDFEITHFLRYKFVSYWNSYLLPLLQKRHEQKKAGNALASTINKLIQNSHYGRQGMESSNYDQVLLTTAENLCRIRKTRLGHLSSKSLSLLGIVRMKRKKEKKAGKQKPAGGAEAAAAQFLDAEAAEGSEEDEEEEEDPEERDARFAEKMRQTVEEKQRLEPFSDVESDSCSEEEEDEPALAAEEGDLAENEARTLEGGSKRQKFDYHFLYALTLSGKERPVVNNLPGAVAVLSNSKKIFLGHIHNMLVCSDPRLTELCYIDTDSCIFSMTHGSWEECLLPDKVERWNSLGVMADESGPLSCHGQMKCEGMYTGGLFKTLKIYRLFDSRAGANYTRCKGVNRYLAEQLEDADFDADNEQSTVVSRTCLRPSASGQILMTRESRKLAVALNFKRKVTSNGVHSFPISFVAEC